MRFARAEPFFAEVTDDLKERGENILAGMEAIKADGDEDEDPLFDSTRDYVEQIDRYKEFQGEATAGNIKTPGAKAESHERGKPLAPVQLWRAVEVKATYQHTGRARGRRWLLRAA